MSNQIIKFNVENSFAMIIYGDAISDYVAARCLMLNNIFYRGHSLMCESFEKALKSFYFIQTKQKHPERRHDLVNIKNDLKNCEFLDKYENLLKYLSDAHKTRYTDSKNGFPKPHANTYNARQYLDEIDLLWLEIFENLPMPDEIKYAIGFFCPALVVPQLENYSVWITFENKALAPKLDTLTLKAKKACGFI